jgi:hypothetical protein
MVEPTSTSAARATSAAYPTSTSSRPLVPATNEAGTSPRTAWYAAAATRAYGLTSQRAGTRAEPRGPRLIPAGPRSPDAATRPPTASPLPREPPATSAGSAADASRQRRGRTALASHERQGSAVAGSPAIALVMSRFQIGAAMLAP